MLRTPCGFKMLNRLFHVLCMLFVRDQNCIVSFDNYKVANADGCDQTILGAHIAAAHLIEVDITANGVAAWVLRLKCPQRAPGAHVAPAKIGGNH